MHFHHVFWPVDQNERSHMMVRVRGGWMACTANFGFEIFSNNVRWDFTKRYIRYHSILSDRRGHNVFLEKNVHKESIFFPKKKGFRHIHLTIHFSRVSDLQKIWMKKCIFCTDIFISLEICSITWNVIFGILMKNEQHSNSQFEDVLMQFWNWICVSLESDI